MTFPEMFAALPEAERGEVLRHLEEALKWRGWAALGSPGGMLRHVLGIGEVFARHGFLIAEYT